MGINPKLVPSLRPICSSHCLMSCTLAVFSRNGKSPEVNSSLISSSSDIIKETGFPFCLKHINLATGEIPVPMIHCTMPSTQASSSDHEIIHVSSLSRIGPLEFLRLTFRDDASTSSSSCTTLHSGLLLKGTLTTRHESATLSKKNRIINDNALF